MFKGFKEFLSRGNIVDLAVAVVIGTAFTALVTKFTDSIITPLITRIGVNRQSNVGILKIGIGGGQTIDLNILLAAVINFLLIAFVVYFFVVLPYNTLRRRGEVEQADDAQIVLLTEIRDLLSQSNGSSSGRHGGVTSTPTPEHGPRADAESL
ncbi:MAG TPA: large-conductance mechanosensitive channel protein MscL [Mycobacterium sp.]|nr:large-conductance mechanosensitive channel protein MscL [Mycobacterium sp.]